MVKKSSPWLAVLLLAAGCGGAASASAPESAPESASESASAPAPGSAPASASASAHAGHGHGHGHGHGGPLVHRFERAGDWSAQFDNPERDTWQKPAEVIAVMKIAPGMTVADLGAGTGYFLPHLSRAVGPAGTVLALDVEADMVRHMTERAAREGLANVQARKVPYDDPQLAESSVDRILIVDTWHHIPERARYAARLRAALRPGGAVLIVDFTEATRRGPPRHHRISPEQASEELRAGGLSPEIAAEDLPDQYVVIGRRP